MMLRYFLQKKSHVELQSPSYRRRLERDLCHTRAGGGTGRAVRANARPVFQEKKFYFCGRNDSAKMITKKRCLPWAWN